MRIYSHEYMIELKNQRCIIYLDINEQYHTHSHAKLLYIYISISDGLI